MQDAMHGSLVSSADVNGNAVYGRDGERIGTIDHLMIDKLTGKVAYAVMGFGGFLGLGEAHYPIPWSKLSFDVTRDGFVTDLTEAEVSSAPTVAENSPWDRQWETQTHEHYRIPPYWI